MKNKNQERVRQFMNAIPAQSGTTRDLPGIPPLDVRILRARLMLEEVFETIQLGLGLEIGISGQTSRN